MQQQTPGADGWTGTAVVRVEARLVGGRDSDGVPAVDLSRHDPRSLPEPDPELFNNFLVAFEPSAQEDPWHQDMFRRGVMTSAAVASRGGTDEVPDMVVDRLFCTLSADSACVAVAIVDRHTCRAGLRPRMPWDQRPRMRWFTESHDGMLLTMTCPDPDAPVELFPALLHTWASWSYRRALRLSGPEIENREVPQPPARLDLVVKDRCFPVQLRDFTPHTWFTPNTWR
ncbi:hypothetical protein [Streptomyces prunicolor]|uniref:hypothetical protein n=1 Tax=Streptomyces prunicolor TaxID=67348 RepID=UPI0003663405|nr:hypothetical protein [Streptomyces prunicolor]